MFKLEPIILCLRASEEHILKKLFDLRMYVCTKPKNKDKSWRMSCQRQVQKEEFSLVICKKQSIPVSLGTIDFAQSHVER